MMNFSGSIKPNFKVISIAMAFLFVNVLLINKYYYSHGALSSTLDHYRSKIISSDSSTSINSEFSDQVAGSAPSGMFEELYQSSADKDGYYEKYSIKYLPNYTSTNLKHKNTVLVTSLISTSSPYGRDRTFNQFFNEVVRGFDFNYQTMSLGFLCLDSSEYAFMKKQLKEYFANEEIPDSQKFNKVTILYAPFLNENEGKSREDRQKPSFQKKRRSSIAKSRNFLINNILEYETYILTVDADIITIDPDTLTYFVESGKDVVVPRIQRGVQEDYDLNSWKGERRKPNAEELKRLVASQKKAMTSKNREETYNFVPMDVDGRMQHLNQMSQMLRANKKTKLNELVEVDSVGGAVLFFKSEIFKMGVQFPPFYVIGSDWNLPLGGYDGIETEGLCYEARIIGYSCWAMPNLVAKHSEL